jgi:MFS family permease
MSMGAGTIADIFEPHERGRAFAYYTCGPLLGPAIGPIIGGYLNQGLGWRSTFWFLAIFCFFVWVGIVIFLPETWRPTVVPPPAPVDPLANDPQKSEDVVPGSITSSTSTFKQEQEHTDLETKHEEPTKKEEKRRVINPIAALQLLRFPNISLAVTFVGVL